VPYRLASLLLTLPLLLGGSAGQETPVVAVIVHPSRADTPTLPQIRRIFLRQQRFWGDRSPILPVGLPFGTPVREHFERRVFGKQAANLGHYWDEQYFQGVLPPSTLGSEDAVRQYVAARPGAIGYVQADNVNESVRVVAKLD